MALDQLKHDRVLNQIQKLKAEFPDLIISVDGSVTLKTAPKLIEAGVARLVIGSAIFNTDDIIGRVEAFRAL
jgi:pentose-5-phosphate-3-epimerase